MALAACRAAVARAVGRAAGLPDKVLLPWVERPRVIGHGDLAIPFARIVAAAKQEGLPKPPSPSVIASRIVPDEFIRQAADGGGFVNLHLDRGRFIEDVIRDVHSRGNLYGHADEMRDELVLVEFSSPNIAKPFHAGHLRSTILGNIISNLYKASGYRVLNVNYLGDWGTQYGLLSVGFRKFGDEALLERDPIKHLFDVYVRINAEEKSDPTIRDQARASFALLESGDETELKLWRRFRDLSLKEYDRLYAMLGISFDVHDGESFHHSAAPAVTAELIDRGIARSENGAVIADLTDEKMGVFVLEKKDGASTYASRDIAAAQNRLETYKFDKMIYVAGESQYLHFQRVFELIRKLRKDDLADKLSHVGFGLVRGMSTRKGEVVFLEDILSESSAAVRSVIASHDDRYASLPAASLSHLCHHLGLSSVVVQDLTSRRIKDYTFDWSRMTDARGDTGIYLQYAHARLMGIERGYNAALPAAGEVRCAEVLAGSEEAFRLAVEVAMFPSVVEVARERREPAMVVHYLFELGHAFSTANNVLRVKGQAKEIADPRMLLFAATRYTLANGLRLLGLEPLDVV